MYRTFSDSKELERVLRNARKHYNEGKPFMSDEEYDILVDRLKTLDPNNVFFDEVESILDNSHWEKFNHLDYKMGSLSKINKEEEMNEWVLKHNEDISSQYKLDGNSLKMIYNKGKLVFASTRGNGEIGEDITRNVLKMQGVPSGIPYMAELIIRAETILTKEDYDKLPEGVYKNPRNACTGITKGLDGDYCNFISVICTSIMNSESKNVSTDLAILEGLGFKVVWNKTIFKSNLAKEIQDIYNDLENGERDKLPYEIDGLVLKANIIYDEGENWHHPKNQVAYKFKAQYKSTVVKDICWQYEGSRLTPVAEIEPTFLSGATITNVTLHNADFLKKSDIAINDKIEISRAGDVIPKFSTLLEKASNRIEILYPTNCPICDSTLSYEGAYIYCRNELCPAKATRSIINWLNAHDSKGIASATIKVLFENKLFSNLIEFLNIPNNPIKCEIIGENIAGLGKGKLKILVTEINKSIETNDIVKFFDSLGMENFGKRRIKTLLDYFSKLYKKDISANEFCTELIRLNDYSINGFANLTNEKIKEEFLKKEKIVYNLIDILPKMTYIYKSATIGKLNNLSFCFTGVLETLKRAEAELLVSNNGGTIKGVSNGLSYLVTNEDSNSKKAIKAKALSIKVISEKEFLNMIK